MRHIRQKIKNEGLLPVAYTVVVTDNWNLPLEEHPSIVEHPDKFEIVDNEIPETAQYLNYV